MTEQHFQEVLRTLPPPTVLPDRSIVINLSLDCEFASQSVAGGDLPRSVAFVAVPSLLCVLRMPVALTGQGVTLCTTDPKHSAGNLRLEVHAMLRQFVAEAAQHYGRDVRLVLLHWGGRDVACLGLCTMARIDLQLCPVFQPLVNSKKCTLIEAAHAFWDKGILSRNLFHIEVNDAVIVGALAVLHAYWDASADPDTCSSVLQALGGQ